jgi:hypothetical protein
MNRPQKLETRDGLCFYLHMPIYAPVVVLIFIWGSLLNSHADVLFFRNLSLPGKPSDIDGSKIVGSYWDSLNNKKEGYLSDNGLVYNISVPGALWTEANSISGGVIVGSAGFNSGTQGFLFDGNSYSLFSRGYIPFVGTKKNTIFTGISSGGIVGWVYEDTFSLGFVLKNGVFTDLRTPYLGGQVAVNSSMAFDISGDTVLLRDAHVVSRWLTKNLSTGLFSELEVFGSVTGSFKISEGKVLSAGNFANPQGDGLFTRIYLGNAEQGYQLITSTQQSNSLVSPNTGYNFPVLAANSVEINALDGTTVVGSYKESGVEKYFIGSVPEPTCFSLLLVGGAVLMAGRRRRV